MLPRGLILGVGCLLIGWALLFASGHVGDAGAVSTVASMIGGIILYAWLVIVPLTALIALLVLLRAGVARIWRSPRLRLHL